MPVRRCPDIVVDNTSANNHRCILVLTGPGIQRRLLVTLIKEIAHIECSIECHGSIHSDYLDEANPPFVCCSTSGDSSGQH